jgi:hypothetical protein
MQGETESVGRQRMFRLVSMLSGILGAMIAKRLLRAVYRVVQREDPSVAFDPTAQGFSWPNAFAWALAAGVGLVMTKMVSDRVAAAGWKAAIGTLPPSGKGA